MDVLARITALARADVPASKAAEQIGLSYREMAALIRKRGLFKTYTAIREAEQLRALSRIFSTTDSAPPLPPIPARRRRKRS